MDTLTIEGVLGFNGEYPLDISYFTNRELHLIKKESGVRAGELTEAFAAGDNDLMVCIAAIVVWRKTGTEPNMAAFWDAEAGKFTFNMEEPETEEDDDESIPLSTESEPSDTPTDSSKEDGETSNGTSALPESVLHRIGAQG
jgi:hypothetical protein